MIGERVLGLPAEPRVDTRRVVPRAGRRAVPDEPTSYRINDDADQIAREHDRLRVLARVVDAGHAPGADRRRHRAGLALLRRRFGRRDDRGVDGRTGRADGPCPVARRRHALPTAERGRHRGARALDVTQRADRRRRVRRRARARRAATPRATRGRARRDDRGREARRLDRRRRRRLDPVRRAARARAVRHAVAHAARAERAASTDTTARGAACSSHAFTARGLADVDARGEVWTMHGGTDSAEWYVAALERALDVIPAEVFPAGFDPARRDRPGARAGLRDPLARRDHRRRPQAAPVAMPFGYLVSSRTDSANVPVAAPSKPCWRHASYATTATAFARFKLRFEGRIGMCRRRSAGSRGAARRPARSPRTRTTTTSPAR